MQSLIQREKVSRRGRGDLAIEGTITSVWQMCRDAESDVTDAIVKFGSRKSGVFSRLVQLGLIPGLVKDDEGLS